MENRIYNAILSLIIVAALAGLFMVGLHRSQLGEERVVRTVTESHEQTRYAMQSIMEAPQKFESSWDGGTYHHSLSTTKKSAWSDRELVERHYSTLVVARDLMPEVLK